MKSITTTVLFVSYFLCCFSQDLKGKWYMVNRSGLIEFTISKDSITSRRLFSDFSPKEDDREAYKLLRTVYLNDRILLISSDEKDSTKFRAMTLINYSDDKYFQLAWNGIDTAADQIETIIEVNSTDHRQLFGYYAFSEHYTDTLKKMRPIESMALNDFKNYARAYVNRINQTHKEFEKYNIGYVAAIYNFQIITQALFDVGFNPLQNVRTVEAIYVKYDEDPEVKAIFNEMETK